MLTKPRYEVRPLPSDNLVAFGIFDTFTREFVSDVAEPAYASLDLATVAAVRLNTAYEKALQ